MHKLYNKYLSNLHDTDKYRKLPAQHQGSYLPYLDFSTNDYLGLSRHPEILRAAIFAAERYGVGATGSRLLSGNNELFESLEAQIAKDKHREAALIFNSGFQANFSVLSALLDIKILEAKPLVFFDKLNHASLYQAAFLSAPELIRYNHNDMEHLSSLLIKYKDDDRPKFIVTETVFGMDGDLLPINEAAALAKEHKAFLYLDEAHAIGVFGPHGYGLSTTIDLTNISCLIMGTFSKALGSSGGYVACDLLLKDYLINKASGFIYSTANSPMVIGAASKAWEMIRNLKKERQQLLSLSVTLKEKLVNLGFNIAPTASHIIPIILGSEEAAIHAKEKLFQNNIIVSCIRPPTVSPGSSRLRIALTSNHTELEIEELVRILGTL